MNLQDNYSRESFMVFLKSFIPSFQTDIRVVNNRNLEITEEAYYLGESSDLDLAVFEIKHTSSSDARVALATDGFRIMKQSATFKALVVYKPAKGQNWRLSLMTATPQEAEKGKVKTVFSNPRRYSFFLGPEAKIHTPNNYLINKGPVKSIDDLIGRFDVELVTKEFFQKYKELYEKISKHLQNDRGFSIFAGKNNVDIDTFAKKLLGQIVFLYFIQRKGWLGAAKGGPISSGDKNFVRSLFNKAKTESKHFFNDYLEYLFYNALNKKPEKPGSFYREYFECQIPFLNGGLFEPIENYDWQNEVLNIPDTIFSNNQGNGVLDVFDLFNFTVYEDDPIDKEVSIDPEMLGKVFENLLPENLRKGKGAYYTPREIVHYMCQESLINYLAEKSEIKPGEIRDHIKRLKISTDETTEIPAHIVKKAKILDELLAGIKIVDPAVGSGAFLVGMLHEIVNFRVGLNPIIKKRRSEYELKKQAIINSLYGVDIDSGAVEIAKLRLWLSLVVDYALDDIDPLPNLDFKIMQGNSLIERLSPSLLAKTTDNSRNCLIDELNKIKANYSLLTDHSKKKEVREQINKLVRVIVNYDIAKEKKKIWAQIISKKAQTKLFIDPVEEMSSSETDDKEAKKLSKQLHELDKVQRVSPTEHFEWHVSFNEVFEKDGFDVIIANPPYVGDKGHKDIFRPIKNSAFGGKYYKGQMDLFYYFFHLALDLCRATGMVTFITTNYYLTADGAVKLRNDFHDRAVIRKMINLNELKIFESATGQHNIITMLSKQNNDSFVAYNCITRRQGAGNEKIIGDILSWVDEKTDYFKINQCDLYDGVERYIRIGGCSAEGGQINRILGKIASNSKLLGKICKINAGIGVTVSKITQKYLNAYPTLKLNTNDGVFVVSPSEYNNLEKEILKEFVKNSDIQQYVYQTNNDKLIYLTWESDIERYPNTAKHLLKYKKILDDQIICYEEDFPWFALNRPRAAEIFEERGKIIVPYRSKLNNFAYSDGGIYGSRDVLFIRKNDNSYKIKFILALLNSKLYYYWLYHRGKRKGEMLELYQKPLSEIPIKKTHEDEQVPFVEIVDKILSITRSDGYLTNSPKQAKVQEYEKQIDQMVYKLYGLNEKEIKVVEGPR